MKTLLLTSIVSFIAISAQAQIIPNELHSTEQALTVTTNIRSLTHFKAPELGPPALMQNATINTSGWNIKADDNVPDPLALTLYLKKSENEMPMQATSVVYNTLYPRSYNSKLVNELKNRFAADNRFAYAVNMDLAKINVHPQLKLLMAGE